ncbi:glycoside hydrolase [Neocallimastix lanati (nom. inval.)]|nr:glycoside hydrolase [Neocallimastix sp. JGI-2020a]
MKIINFIQYFLILILIVVDSDGMTLKRKNELKEKTKQMIYHAFNGYMKYAFPMDELYPLTCKGRTRDYANPDNYGINDVLGNYTLTLIDSLDTLAVIGDKKAFQTAVEDIIKTVDFNCDCKVQIFEVNIRILGGLLSGHLFAISDDYGVKLDNYNNELLDLAYNLGKRLLPAFEYYKSEIPLTRVNLKKGVLPNETNNCSAGAGTLILEFGTLSRLTGDMRFENYARKALFKLWNKRSKLDLVGNTINSSSSKWENTISGIGAGIDSLFEYMFKAYILFGDPDYLKMFNDSYKAILKYVKDQDGVYVNVNMDTGFSVSSNMDGLSAFFPGLQVLIGDIPNAIHLHQIFAELWNKYHAIPEVFNFNKKEVENDYYLLRPEFIESNYMLYQATKDPYYLVIGEMILYDIENFCKTECGYAQLNPLTSLKKEDRMESFFISESLKYLYLLFDEDNRINKEFTNSVFTTEGHFLLLPHSVYHNKNYENSSHLNSEYDSKGKCPYMVFHLGKPLISDNEKMKIFTLVNKVTPREELLYTNPVCPIDIKKESIDLHVKSDNDKDQENYPPFKIIEKPKYYVINTLYNVDIEITKFGTSTQLMTKINKIKLNLNKNVYIIMEGIEFLLSPDAFQDNLKIYNLKCNKIMITAAKAIYGPQLNAEQVWDMNIIPIFKNSNYSNPSLAEGCSEYSPKYKEIIKGKVIMVSRGSCFFSEKTKYAMKAGAAGIIIANTNNQIYTMSPYKENKFNPIQYKMLLNKFKELEQEVIDLVENDIPYHKRKQEVDEYTIPSLMVSKSDSELIMKQYLKPLSNYSKNEFKNLLKLLSPLYFLNSRDCKNTYICKSFFKN